MAFVRRAICREKNSDFNRTILSTRRRVSALWCVRQTIDSVREPNEKRTNAVRKSHTKKTRQDHCTRFLLFCGLRDGKHENHSQTDLPRRAYILRAFFGVRSERNATTNGFTVRIPFSRSIRQRVSDTCDTTGDWVVERCAIRNDKRTLFVITLMSVVWIFRRARAFSRTTDTIF